MALRYISLDELRIEDERALRAVALYGSLKRVLAGSGHRFLVPEAGIEVSWDRVLFLNLTYWSDQAGTDVLCSDRIPADVLAHIAWHEVIGRRLSSGSAPSAGPPSARALFFAESIASAFDLYLVGRLLLTAPDSDFITTQLPQMAERAEAGGLPAPAFAALMQEVSRAPERAFEDMRALLLDVSTALHGCQDVLQAEHALERFVGHRFEPLLHHFELSNWILYARAHGAAAAEPNADALVAEADQTLRRVPDALAWLEENWLDSAPG